MFIIKVLPMCVAIGRMMTIAIMAAAAGPQGTLYPTLIEAAGIKLGSFGFADVVRTSSLRPLHLILYAVRCYPCQCFVFCVVVVHFGSGFSTSVCV